MGNVNGNLKAVPLGLKPGFGYGDRLGLATPVHLAAHKGSGFVPIFAQRPIREMARTKRTLKRHVAIARELGPYKISVHSGSDKFSINPIIGRVCGNLLHVKTAGTSYLEALRVVARVNAPLFREIVD